MKRKLSKMLHVVAAMVGRTMGVKVEMSSLTSQPCTDGKVIRIPNIDEKDAALAIGMIDHEAGHNAETDMDVWKKHATSAFKEGILNTFEDVRIERLVSQRYPGAKQRIQEMLERLLKEGYWKTTTESPENAIGRWILFESRAVDQNRLFGSMADTVEPMVNSLLGQETATKIKTICQSAASLLDTEACGQAADKVLKLIQNEVPSGNGESPDDSDDSGDQKGEAGDGGSSDDSDDSGDQKGEAGDGGSSDGSDDSGDQKGEAGDGGSSDGSDDSGDQKGEAGDGGNSDGSGDSGDQKGEARNAGGNGKIKAFDQNKNGVKALSDVLKEALGKAAKDNCKNSGAYTPGHATITEKAKGEPVDLSKVRQVSGQLRSRLVSRLQEAARKKSPPRRVGSNIDTRVLHRIAANDTRVFTRNEWRKGIDAHVTILLDQSGSMGTMGSRIQVATDAAAALSMALDQIHGVDSMIEGFGGSMDLAILKKVNIPTKGAKLTYAFGGGTPLTEAIITTAPEILSSKRRRKILFVITDGAPNDPASAKQMMEAAENDGIEVYGIGILHDVSGLFNRSTSINTLEELPGKMFDTIGRMLLG